MSKLNYQYYCNECDNITILDEKEESQQVEKECEHCTSNDIDFEEIIDTSNF